MVLKAEAIVAVVVEEVEVVFSCLHSHDPYRAAELRTMAVFSRQLGDGVHS